MVWLIVFVATWCAFSLLLSDSDGFGGCPPWVVFLVAGLAAAILVSMAFVVSHLARAVLFYAMG